MDGDSSDSFQELDDEEYDPSYNTRNQRKRRQSSKSTKTPRKRNARSSVQTPVSIENTVDDDALIAQEEDEAILFDTVGGDNDEESVTKAAAHKDDWEESDFIVRQEQLSPESKQHQETTFGTHVCRNSWENLFEYQREGCKWMFSLFREGVGGILADEMGLGKTAQVAVHFGSLGKMNHILNERRQSMFLIVCPATVLVHWLKEMHRWAPDMRTGILHTISVTGREMLSLSPENLTQVLRNIRRSSISQGVAVITSYETMRRSVAALSSIEWTAVCLDEGHKIRNPEAAITLACKTLPAFHRLILSGTPIQNSLVELWCLFDFIYPGKLGNRHVFEEEFAYPIRIGAYAHATKLQYEVAIRCAGTLQRLVKPYLLRRKKEDLQAVAKLPPKTEQVLFCPISKRQRVIYEQILQSDEVQKVIARKIPAFRAINQLRKLCNHPALVYQDGAIQWAAVKDTKLQQRLQEEVLAEKKRQYQEDQAFNNNALHGNDSEDEEFMLQYRLSSQGTVLHPSLKNHRHNENGTTHQHLVWSDSGKLLVLSKILPIWQREGHKVLVFCQTTSMLHLIEQMILNMHFTYLRLDGQTPIGKRDGLISEFNANESIFLMLLTTRTGGVGISLTAANRIVLFDPDWNPMTDIQARERAWRLGQRREVVIYRLITKGTIEEKIYHRQIFKLLMSHRVLDDPKQKNLFSKSQMQDLFDLAPEVTGADIAEAHQEHVANQTTTGIKPFFVENRPGASGHTGFAGKELPMAGQVPIWEVENADEYNDHIAQMAGLGSLAKGPSNEDTTLDTSNGNSTSDGHENARSHGALRTSNIINNIFNSTNDNNSSSNSDNANLGLEEAFHIETITAEKQHEEAEVYNMLLDIQGGPLTHLEDDEDDHNQDNDDDGDALTRHFRAINSRQPLRTTQSNTNNPNNSSSNSSSGKKASTNHPNTEHQAHDRKLLRALFENEAIVSIYSHDYLEPTKNNPSMSKRAKEEALQLARQADKRAERAFQSLQSSSTVYQPSQNSSSSGNISHTVDNHHQQQHHPDVLSRYFGSVPANATEAGHATSSSSLLSAIRQRENDVCPAVSRTSDTLTDSVVIPSGIEEQLKQRLVNLFRSTVSPPTTSSFAAPPPPPPPYTLSTNQILRHFRDLGDQYAPLFRKLLRNVAVLRNGSWVLRDKFK